MKFWTWLSGKKRTIAELYWGIWIPVTQLSNMDIPAQVLKWSAVLGVVLTYAGLTHAAIKARRAE